VAGIFPFMNVPSTVGTKKELPFFREYAWDFELNSMILVNGIPQVVEGREALKVWMYKALSTPRYRYLGYTWNYGSELEQLIGSSFTPAAVQTEAERYVREALLVSPYIRAVPKVSVVLESDCLSIQVQVDTVYGEVKVNV
jgi:hypothetical protein